MTTKFLRSLSKHALDAFKGMIIVGAVAFALQVAYERLSPDYFWVEYAGTRVSDQSENGIKFESAAVFPRGGRASWNDVLKCDINGNGNFTFFSFYESSARLEPDNDFSFDGGDWLYPARFPRNADCFIDNGIEVRTPLGFTKVETTKSPIFTIKDGIVEVPK